MADTLPIDIQELPEKPGGGNWRAVEVQVAWLRAKGKPWKEVAQSTPYVQNTVESYTRKPWWELLYSICAQAALEAEERERQLEELEERDQWRSREEELVQEGIILALETLIDTMKGKPLRDPETGKTVVNMFGQPRIPDAQTKTIAARTFAQIAGYKKAKEELASLLIKRQEKALELENKQDNMAIDISIHGVGGDGEGGGQ